MAAATRREHGEEHPRVADVLIDLGASLGSLCWRTRSPSRSVNGADHPRVASALNDLGPASLQRGRLDEAEASFRRMLGICTRVYPEEHYLQGTASSNLASVHLAKGDLASAEELYRAAVAAFERTLPPGHLSTGIARIKLGRALLRRGRCAEAIAETLAGYEVVRAHPSPSVSWLQAACEDLATAHDALGDEAQAQAYRVELAGHR